MIEKGMSLEQVAYQVCTAFDRIGVLAVLVGGSAAAYYAPHAMMTKDLDFVLHLELFGMPDRGPEILRGLGFRPSSAAGTLEHDDIPFTLEILDGPLAVGAEDVERWDTERKDGLLLHVIPPIVSVKDRLAHAIHNGDVSAARQAAEVAKNHPVDLRQVKAWCEAERPEGGRGATVFGYFEAFLKTA